MESAVHGMAEREEGRARCIVPLQRRYRVNSAGLKTGHYKGGEKGLERASSMAAMASSRLTLGYCSRNWSSVSPPSKYSIKALKGTRVPRKTGSAPKMF